MDVITKPLNTWCEERGHETCSTHALMEMRLNQGQSEIGRALEELKSRQKTTLDELRTLRQALDEVRSDSIAADTEQRERLIRIEASRIFWGRLWMALGSAGAAIAGSAALFTLMRR